MNHSRPMPIRIQLLLTTFILVAAGSLHLATAAAGATLQRVQKNNVVQCGVSEDLMGFSLKDAAGNPQGFAVDFCRAVAAAALGDANRISLVPVSSASRFPVLLANKIDLLAHTTTWNLGREAGIGLAFAGVYLFDGQTFLVPRSSGVRSVEDLNGAVICIEKGTTHVVNLEEVFQAKGFRYEPLIVESLKGVTEAFFAGRCQAYTSDMSKLAAVLAMSGRTSEFEILPGFISKEPIGPVVRRGDEEWLTLVRWVLFALLEAEEQGVTRANVRALQAAPTRPSVRRFLFPGEQLARALGVNPEWVVRVIEAVGNYGEIYERNLGNQSALRIERGYNRLWKDGGLLYSPPFN